MDLASRHRIVLFGGTFDPPHAAHVALPALACRAVGADAVAYIPAKRQPLKSGLGQTPAHHRLAMLRLALETFPVADAGAAAVILTDELDRPGDGPSYTVDTLESLRARLGDKPMLHLLIGADQVRLLPRWRNAARILQLAQPLVMLRPPDTRQTLLAGVPAELAGHPWEKWIVTVPQMDVSATDIRRCVALGQSIAGLVTPAVAEYIGAHGLYRHGA